MNKKLSVHLYSNVTFMWLLCNFHVLYGSSLIQDKPFFVFLKGRETKTYTEKNGDLPSAGSLSKRSQQPGLGQAESGSTQFNSGLRNAWQSPRHLRHCLLFHKVHAHWWNPESEAEQGFKPRYQFWDLDSPSGFLTVSVSTPLFLGKLLLNYDMQTIWRSLCNWSSWFLRL